MVKLLPILIVFLFLYKVEISGKLKNCKFKTLIIFKLFKEQCTSGNQGQSPSNGAITVKNAAGLIIKSSIEYTYQGSLFQRTSDSLAINQQYTFVIPYGASAVLIRIKTTLKTLYENSISNYDNACLIVTGTLFKANVASC